MRTSEQFDKPFDLMLQRLESIPNAAEQDKLRRQLIAERARRIAERARKCCRVCGGTYSAAFFKPHRATCRGCLQTRSDQKKARDRFPTKVQWSRRSHARRLGRPSRELQTVFGWTDVRMLEDVRRVWAEGCPCCGQTPRWRHQLQLWLLDRTRPPEYGTNTTWICTFCSGWAQAFGLGLPQECAALRAEARCRR